MDAKYSTELFVSAFRLVHVFNLGLEHNQLPGILFRIRRFHLVLSYSSSDWRAIGSHGRQIRWYVSITISVKSSSVASPNLRSVVI